MKNLRDAGGTVIESLRGKRQLPARFVRLSQLRKLRECEQVAAVCYRVRGSSIEFLLVRTRGSGRWTFPKGSAEPGLTHAQAAALEAFEEAGVHGRIEEVSFARYIRKRSSAGNHASISDEKAVTVKAYLCEVLRLTAPQEPRRDRTWFPADEAKRCLREGRKTHDGTGLTRVIDTAVARIERLGRSEIADDRGENNRPRPDQSRLNVQQKDALQKVQFDFAEAYGRLGEAASRQSIRREFNALPQPGGPVEYSRQREVLQCEVLEFNPPQLKKDRALGTGARKS